jgi:methyltransferase
MGGCIMVFIIFMGYLVTQRLVELWIARNNERWMKQRGAIEVGKEHYPLMILLHMSFFLGLFFEVQFFERGLSTFWHILLLLFILTQFLRIWALTSLGRYWNTKIIILPNSLIVKKGPYKFIRHPNYIIVVIEILIIPLLFQAYWTALVFSVLNAWMLAIRIKVEERALIRETDYTSHFDKLSRFSPFNLKKI